MLECLLFLPIETTHKFAYLLQENKAIYDLSKKRKKRPIMSGSQQILASFPAFLVL